MFAVPVDMPPSPRVVFLEANPMTCAPQDNLLFFLCPSKERKKELLGHFQISPVFLRKRRMFVSKPKTKSNQNKNAGTQIPQGTNPGDTQIDPFRF